MKIKTLFLFSILAVSAAFAAEPDLSKLPPPSDKQGLTYVKDIRPLFESSCFRCHGEERHRGGLRLDTLEAVLKGGEDGKILVPGKSQESLLVIAVAQIDEEKAMPPKRGPQGARGGPGGFGPGSMLAPQMVSQADKNADKKVTREEFTGLSDAWFDKFDKEKAGKLSQQQFIDGLTEVLPAPQGFGNRGGADGRGPAGEGRRGGFSPARFAGPGVFSAADANKDGTVTRAELTGTFTKWFTDWDKEKSNSLNEGQIRDGLNGALPRPNFGGPGGFGGRGGANGPGGPGGPGAGPQSKPLTREQVSLVRAWIDQGAK